MNICWNRIRLALVALACVGLSGCDWVLLDSKGMVGLAQRDLILICIGLMLIVVIPAIVLTFVFAWRYRAGNTKAKYMPDWSHSTKVEIVVWGVPLIIIAVLAVIVWKSTHELDPYKPLDVAGEPLHVDVIATDWKWVFVYPDLGIATVNQLNFPANRPLAFNITSNSTMNTFFIPQLGGQIYAMAGMRTQLHLIANEPGQFRGMSGNYSGHGFSNMKFIATASSNEDFERWVAEVRNAPAALSFTQFKALAAPSKNAPVQHFSSVEPLLFKKVIDQFIGVGENTAAATPAGAAGGAQVSQE
ncbi:TPA: ubiquinol oxidase subunit II [Stenotrophomonas maltophilia]|jgi:cytochrome o ubiquinol oxidase subunit 2|uniref:ubiquinol oxidase subunit II n=1 Tax=Stenotrophomonas TaxID=40323 RepID=UPI0007897F0F|nr:MULTISPECIES: ubiquinol oxidase subunit II [Stenotrophomonas]SSM86829.1 cytochrome o ubiquinol oxidase subunit II [Acinetobacter baumannii]KYK42270.1 cytochrome ubiquinol oxidase subunit II [Stenotrophomonas maltophilia]MBH1499933.1 ubiquinol oxidase subunit II [Stenotrophomonas maltophilia]MBH1532024.1 ubiquinol oxidase subunit II [Stenotrophomonas maltophilia]MBH1880017.1 ubiquinol oxidase subunit II [Stenotrophomonas maltophilia]